MRPNCLSVLLLVGCATTLFLLLVLPVLLAVT